MKKAIIAFLFLSACSNNNNVSIMNNSLNKENIFNLSINQYKEMLNYYSENNDYPKIDK
tara:strand:+ start:109 stop:285 length:177 start_codon:yes stop_codon:yes gene_type:complete